MAEFVPGYEATSVYGIGAPGGTPPEIIERLNKEINAGLADPAIRARLAELGSSAFATSPAEYAKFIAAETERLGQGGEILRRQGGVIGSGPRLRARR